MKNMKFSQFDDIFDNSIDDSSKDLTSAAKNNSKRLHLADSVLNEFVERHFRTEEEFSDFLKKVFDTNFFSETKKEFNHVIAEDCKTFNEFEKFGNGIEKISDIFEFSSIESIKFPYSTRYICTCAFLGSKLRHLEIPPKLKIIDDNAFQNCVNLKTVTCAPRKISSNDFELGSIESYAFLNSKIEIVDLSNFKELISIEKFAFAWNNIKELKLPNKLARLCEAAFQGNALEELDLSNTQIITIEKDCFLDCKELKEVKFPKTVETIGSSAFNNTALVEVHIPKHVKFDKTSFPEDCHIIRDL